MVFIGLRGISLPIWHGRSPDFPREDLDLLWEAILNMFENDRSAARGKMAVRELIVFKHASELGNAPAYKLFDAVHRAGSQCDFSSQI